MIDGKFPQICEIVRQMPAPSSAPVVSLISPVYNASAVLDQFIAQSCEALAEISANFELILVDDRSQDGSWEQIRKAGERDRRIVAVRLSRNYGQHRAILAGLTVSKGEAVAIIDCDLQEHPKYLTLLYLEYQNGSDVVMTRRINRDDRPFKRLTSNLFHKVFNRLSSDPSVGHGEGLGNLCLLSRRVVDILNSYSELTPRFIPMVQSVGFPKSFVDIPHSRRAAGRSTYRIGKLIGYAIDGISSYSSKLLYMSAVGGTALSLIALLSAGGLVIARLLYEFQVGWASIIVTLLFATGLILLSQGIVGFYIGKIFDQVKGRPLFIISDTINCEFTTGVRVGTCMKSVGQHPNSTNTENANEQSDIESDLRRHPGRRAI